MTQKGYPREHSKNSEVKEKKMSSRWNLSGRSVGSAVMIGSLVVTTLLQGCSTVGPKLYEASFNDYTDAISKTADGQMLGNLVRMRYYESPVFLQVHNITTSFSVGANAGASATLNEGASDSYGISAGGNVSETPTITFSMPESQKYYGRMLAPLSAKQVTSLVLAGFESELVFNTAVRGVNGLRNISADLESSSEQSAAYTDFKEAFALIKKLRAEGIIDLELGGKETFWSSPIKVDAKSDLSQVLMLGAASYAMSNDAEIVGYPDGTWQTHKYEKHMALRFAPGSNQSPDARRLKKLLALKPDRYNFSMVEAEMVNAEKPRGILGQPPGALDPSVIWVEIGLRGRSMLEIMQVASKQVEVPGADISKGTAAGSSSQGESDWLVIRSSESEPKSHLRIKHRGHWFYIDESDLRSRQSFAMINALFAVVGGTVPGAAPVMTIPLGL
jgi:hypothetical protein